MERVIAMLCELVKNVSITRACLPVAKRCVMKRDMLAKRIDSLCVELEHQFDTINTLRNLADEAETDAERQWVVQQRDRVEEECKEIEKEILDIKQMLEA